MRLIELRGRNKPSIWAMVDDEDYDRVIEAGPWHRKVRSHTTYVYRAIYADGRQITQQLHNFITGFDRVDHIDHDGLNNQRLNLRLATQRQNMQNRRPLDACTSQYKGVCWHKRGGKWQATIRIDGIQTYLGMFDDEVEAALTYDHHARIEYGDFAYLNFPDV
jgi:hypothetical protein